MIYWKMFEIVNKTCIFKLHLMSYNINLSLCDLCIVKNLSSVTPNEKNLKLYMQMHNRVFRFKPEDLILFTVNMTDACTKSGI